MLDILEDSYGFIWYGGSSLMRFNGQDSKDYSKGLKTVNSLLEDSRGRVWVGASNGLFKYDRETDQMVNCYSDKILDSLGEVYGVLSIFEDGKSRLWVGGRDIILAIDITNDKLLGVIHIEAKTSYQRTPGVRAFTEDCFGHIFASTTNGLWEINADLSLTHFFPETAKNDTELFMIFDAKIGNKDSLWLATAMGLYLFETQSHKFCHIEIPKYKSQLIRTILPEDNGQLWIASANEIWKRNQDGTLNLILDNSTFKTTGINVFLKDKFGNLWIGGNDGVGRMDLASARYQSVYKILSPKYNQDNFFFRVIQDTAGGFWFRMLSSGLGYCERLGGEFKMLQPPNIEILGDELKNLCTDADGNTLIITLTKGLYKVAKGSTKLEFIDLGDSMFVASTASIIADNQNQRLLWFSSKFGLCSVDRLTHQRKWYHPKNDLAWLDKNTIGQIEQAADGNIWCEITSKDKKGIGYFDVKKQHFFAEPNLFERSKSIPLYQMKRVLGNTIWAASSAGMIHIDTDQKKQTLITPENGLPTKNALSIAPDKAGNIWFTSGNKFCRYDGNEFDCYIVSQAIGSFCHSSGTLTKNGDIVFGGKEGLFVFDPEKIKKDTLRPKVYLTNFWVQSKERNLGKAYELVKEITLPFEENAMSFEFAAPYFINANLIEYQYILEGFDKEWIIANKKEKRIPYANLTPGVYTFKVKATNAYGLQSSEKDSVNIKIIIQPPWYRKWWAYCLWVALFIGGILCLYYFSLRQKLAAAESRRLQELDSVKTRLYTNITHEFRTPLTIILGETAQVKSEIEKSHHSPITNTQYLIPKLAAIHRNGQQLLNLINQMLDLAKLEGGSLKLNMAQGDVILFLKYLLESFQSLATAKGVSLHFEAAANSFFMDFDTERLRQIVTNLLSNAVKFTPEGGEVYLRLTIKGLRLPGVNGSFSEGKPTLEIRVEDTGAGIPAEHLPQLFDRFYQVEAPAAWRQMKGGTGIGLTLTKELVELLGGEISVESSTSVSDGKGTGTTFTVSLPISRKAAEANTEFLPEKWAAPTPVPEKNELPDDPNLPQLLLIEDNADVANYVVGILKNEYRVLFATNGKLGLEKALDDVPDIILSDVMMPEMDGNEVCQALKSDLRTSHVPVVLLTAKADFDSRLEGLEGGADAYLAKPFEERELRVVLRKLLENRELMRLHYTSGEFVGGAPSPSETVTASKAIGRDEQFLKEVLKMVESQLSNPELNAERLAELMFVSYNSLFKKIKALTGMGVTEYVRHIRLHRAAELLVSKKEWTISRISLEVGFNNLNFFSREFKKCFGHNPSKHRQSSST